MIQAITDAVLEVAGALDFNKTEAQADGYYDGAAAYGYNEAYSSIQSKLSSMGITSKT
jgi:hypothetical protein